MASALFVRVDARRPASWIALATGAAGGWWLSRAPAAAAALPVGDCLVWGGLAAVAAIGDLPVDLCAASGCAKPSPRSLAAWAAARVAWPLTGCAALAAAVWPAGAAAIVALTACGVALATASWVAVRCAGFGAADTTSLALLAPAAAAVATAFPAAAMPLAVTGVGLVLAGLGLWTARVARDAESATPPADRGSADGFGDGSLLGPLPAVGVLRRGATRLAMAASLAGMALWLVLHADRGGVGDSAATAVASRMWAVSSMAWFVGLAVPQAALQGGGAGADGWRMLWRSAAVGSRAAGRWPMLRPGAARFAAGVALVHAAILGWPPLVAAVLSLPRAAQAVPPLTIVAALALAAAVMIAVTSCAAMIDAAPETTVAVLLCLAASAWDAELTAWPPWRGEPPASPSPPSLLVSRRLVDAAGEMGDLRLSRPGPPGKLMGWCPEM